MPVAPFVRRQTIRMMTVLVTSLVALWLLTAGAPGAVAGPAEDAGRVVGVWAAAFNANDVEALVRLYAPDATLLGTSSPVLSEGTAAIHAYYARLAGSGNSVAVRGMRAIVLSDDIVLVTGFYDFATRLTVSPGAAARFSMIIVRRNDNWLILHHHSSPRVNQPQ